MKKNYKIFELPYLGYDLGTVNHWEYDVLIGSFGNPIIGIEIRNLVEQFSADPDSYKEYHKILTQVVAILGEDRMLQKLDIFSKQKYKGEESELFLQQKYTEHFNGREFKDLKTLMLFTIRIPDKNTKNIFNQQDYDDLREKVSKIFMLLERSELKPTYLKQIDFEKYISGILTMKFRQYPVFNNIAAKNDSLQIADSHIKTITFVDVEKIELPNEIEAFSNLGGSGTAAETAVDNFTFLNEIEEYETMIYNQVISIPHQAKQQRELEKKKKKHEGVAKNAPANAFIATEIETLLDNIAKDGQLIVEANFSICFSTGSEDELKRTTSLIENKLFTKGILVSENATNQLELFRACLPGNATELKTYDLFMTTNEAAVCFFLKECYPVDEPSDFYLRFTDRQGVPIKVDLSDLPMKQGRINNRNKFVLGPSGSGKSFLMNNIIEQYLNYNYDVVIVDTGDSYSGTCSYKDGKYIKYTEEKPITMNPFKIGKEEFNIEKTEFLSNLIFLIWQGPDAEKTNVQKDLIDDLLFAYYHHFYYGSTNWHKGKTIDDLLFFLKKYNVSEEEIEREVNDRYTENQSYYGILGVSYDATTEEIKKKGRDLIKINHPDKNLNNKDYNPDLFNRIFEAYDTLTDEKKRKIYNETRLILTQPHDVIRKPETQQEWDRMFHNAVIKKIREIEKKMKVKELSFNSFYEFSQKFLPITLSDREHPIRETEFNLRTFSRVLRKFYNGGRYERILNEDADSTLFDEPFIVFEIDNIKDNPVLFPIVTLIIMDTFIQKMRHRKSRRKALIIEEAWKAIASKLMGGYILYLYKTVRKFWGEAIVVTQELNDIIGNAVVKDSIINNSDTFILLDQTKFKDNFSEIASLLSLNQIEQNKIFTINNLDNKFGRGFFKEFYIKRGPKGEVYGNEVSIEQYLTYSTEKPEKTALEFYLESYGNYQAAIENFVADMNFLGGNKNVLVQLINLYQKPMDNALLNYYQTIKKECKFTEPVTVTAILQELKNKKIDLSTLIKQSLYENKSA